jgi:hypothetical protein
MDAFALSEHLTAYLQEHVAGRSTLTLGGQHYEALTDEDYRAHGFDPGDPDFLLIRRTSDGEVFEFWVQAGAQPVRKPLAEELAAL